MRLLKNRVKHLDNTHVKHYQAELVSLYINDKNPRKDSFLRVCLKNNRTILQNAQNIIYAAFRGESLIYSKGLVKKSVRIDNDLYKAIFDNNGINTSFISKIAENAVSQRLNTGVIDLIETCDFPHKITIYFTKEEYKVIENAISELNSRGINWITFSLLVRSILYERFGIVSNSREVNRSVA